MQEEERTRRAFRIGRPSMAHLLIVVYIMLLLGFVIGVSVMGSGE